MSAGYADVNYSQARLGTERNPDAVTVLNGAEQPIRPELQAAARRVVVDCAARFGFDAADVLAMLDLEDVA